jgi:hypothetical protein
MKQVSIFFVCLLTTFSVLGQPDMSVPVQPNMSVLAERNMNAVTITVNGNKTLQITVDGKDYNIINNAPIGNKTTIEIGDLESGQHTFQVTRTDQNTRRREKISTIFNLRRRYDMLINVNLNGSLELIEKMNFQNNGNRPVMNSPDFTKLLNNVKYQRTTSGKRNVITNAFNVTNNYFSCSQVSLLLQQINNETYRLELAKLSYHTVADPNNFNLIYNLLNSQASRNELDAFVNNFNNNEDDDLNGTMSDVSFNSLFETIQQQWPVSTQMNSLTNAFNNSNNYFTSYQASRLIQIVSAESNRLQLAKLSYRSTVDRDNFYQVYELLKSQASRNELENFVNNYHEGGNTGTSMTDASFNNLYQTIQQQRPVSTQMNSLTSIFNNSNNYFTTYQASRLIQLVGAESNRLQLAKLSYRNLTDPANFSQVYSLLSTQAAKNELAAYVANYSGGGYKVAMTDADFHNLYQTIQQQWPLSVQMNSLTAAFNNTNNYFTSYQANQLIQIVYSESNRLQLAKSSYRSITDPDHFSQVSDLLNTQAAKNELAAYVANYTGGGSGLKVAMTDADFNILYQDIQIQFLPGGKMAEVTNAFNNPAYYFTSAQAKKLIELVSFESNRLQLAKLSYRGITDRANFNTVYELLSTQSSRDELTVYVNAYKD